MQTKIGEIVEIDPPLGTLHLDINTHMPQVFIAGGVGIAPFRSRLKYLIDNNKHIPVHLIYSNRASEDISYIKDLRLWESKYEWLKVDYIVSGKVGRIDSSKLEKLINFKSKPTVWITGSPLFVDDLERMLLKLKIPQEKIVTEKFTGY
ncbi:FAD-dependent oxidoreductase [Candidatus Microgenomates bacterium]|nr:FAD-dependent oxidoreductase [Candidatus Microgenomates bacterium]